MPAHLLYYSLLHPSTPPPVPTATPPNIQPSTISPIPTVFCEDSKEKFIVSETEFRESKLRSCEWVIRGDKDGHNSLIPWRCDHPEAKKNCPRACGICIDLSHEPSASPFTQQPSQDDCASCTLTSAMIGGEHHSSSSSFCN